MSLFFAPLCGRLHVCSCMQQMVLHSSQCKAEEGVASSASWEAFLHGETLHIPQTHSSTCTYSLFWNTKKVPIAFAYCYGSMSTIWIWKWALSYYTWVFTPKCWSFFYLEYMVCGTGTHSYHTAAPSSLWTKIWIITPVLCACCCSTCLLTWKMLINWMPY